MIAFSTKLHSRLCILESLASEEEEDEEEDDEVW
jgi:hypothetical protein